MKKKYSNTTYCASFKAQALAHVANGASIYGTAKEFNVAFSTIKQWCRQAQMPICSRELTEKQQEICKDYMESDLTKKEISMKYQVSEGTFRHWLNKYRVIMDSNIISTTNADRVENYATVRPTEPEVREKTLAAVYNNIDDNGNIYGLKTNKRWLELPEEGE